jgi:hypothetical protein
MFMFAFCGGDMYMDSAKRKQMAVMGFAPFGVFRIGSLEDVPVELPTARGSEYESAGVTGDKERWAAFSNFKASTLPPIALSPHRIGAFVIYPFQPYKPDR